MDPFQKEIQEIVFDSEAVDTDRANKSFNIIASGFSELLKTINKEPERTKEGVVDLSKV